MNKAIEALQAAQKRAIAGRPKVGGFPYLAETLRRAGVKAQFMEPAILPEHLSHEGRSGCYAGYTFSLGHGRCPRVRP